MTTQTARQLALPARIKWARENAGYTQERFAEAVGTSRRHVMRWENAKGDNSRPSASYVKRIAEATGQPEDLFTDEDDEESAQLADDLLTALRRLIRSERVTA